MSNSSLVTYRNWSPNHSGARNHPIDTITIHCVVGQCAIETLGNIFASPARQASSNYGIGLDGRIGQFVDEANRSWCSSSSENDNRAITIEVASDNYAPYWVTDHAFEALINLCYDICKRNGKKYMVYYGTLYKTRQVWGSDPNAMYMTEHNWFAATGCPGGYLQSNLQAIATRVNAMLNPYVPEPEEEVKKFADVNDSASYSVPVYWAVKQGIIKGYSDNTFRPENYCTRAQFITMLWRMVGKPQETFTSKIFADVDSSMSSYKAIIWGVNNGIILGYKNGMFGPDDYVTRSQVVVMMWRLVNKPKTDFATNFSDVKKTASAYNAIAWGEEQGIVHGYKDGRFGPDDACKRSQAATFIYRFARVVW